MPWCETCSKFWTPSSMATDGTCPTCGRLLVRPDGPVSAPEPLTAKTVNVKELAGGKAARAPWHFKLLMVALVGYLAWRLVDLVRLVL